MARTEAELDDIVHPVQLDELIDHSEQIVPKLCSFVGLGFDEAMLRFHEAERVVRTPSAMQVREPLRHAPMKWGDRFGEAAAPLIEALASPG